MLMTKDQLEKLILHSKRSHLDVDIKNLTKMVERNLQRSILDKNKVEFTEDLDIFILICV